MENARDEVLLIAKDDRTARRIESLTGACVVQSTGRAVIARPSDDALRTLKADKKVTVVRHDQTPPELSDLNMGERFFVKSWSAPRPARPTELEGLGWGAFGGRGP